MTIDINFTLFQQQLLKWYDLNSRKLPFRTDPTPYRVWISEIMLQQTRVDTVLPYFERFMQEIPNIQVLANISDDKLLKLWQGLGYYNRAKNLKKAAAIILDDYNGIFPSDSTLLQNLPGIGPYTAGAIASIAFGKKTAAIDGNVLRVISRIIANTRSIDNISVKKEIELIVYNSLPAYRIGDYNQALMELGATICLPYEQAKCTACPVDSLCEAYRQNIVSTLPVREKKKPRQIELRTVYVIKNDCTYALLQRPKNGLLSGLYELPNVLGHDTINKSKLLLNSWDIDIDTIIPLKSSKHIFTHIEWQMIAYLVHAKNMKSNKFIWATKEEVANIYSIPSAFKAYVRYL
jgi:A/G-specific adenine glycosylase